MKEHGILFNSQIVLAIKDSRKMQTRRPVTFQNSICHAHINKKEWNLLRFYEAVIDEGPLSDEYSGCYLNVPFLKDIIVPVYPRYKVNDNIWTRETWWKPPEITEKMLREGADTWPKCMYDVEMDDIDRECMLDLAWIKKTSIHMNRWASRFIMPIAKMKVERIQNISPADCINEGIFKDVSFYDVKKMSPAEQSKYYTAAIPRYRSLWNGMYRSKGFGWDVNPWVWVLEWEKML